MLVLIRVDMATSNVPVYTEEQKRYFRIISVVKEEGRLVLLKCLDNTLRGGNIDTILSHTPNKKAIQNALRVKVIKKKQFDILYPGPVDKMLLDVTMLTFLIRYLHPTVSPTDPVWHNPSATDTSICADVVRIREARNKWAHSEINTLSENDFLNEFKELQCILCRLAGKVSDATFDANTMQDATEGKKDANFDSIVKPLVTEAATNTTDSLERIPGDAKSSVDNGEEVLLPGKEEKQSNKNFTSNSDEALFLDKEEKQPDETFTNYITEGLASHADGSMAFRGRDIAVSTGSLDHRQSFVARVVSLFEPFLGTHRNTEMLGKTHLPLQIQSRQPINIPVATFEETQILKLPECSLLYVPPIRCRIDGIVFLADKTLVTSDSGHDVVQAISASLKLISLFPCESPCGLCAIGDDHVAVVLRKSSSILVLCQLNGKLNREDDIPICGCYNWHSDVKYCNRKLYILCETGSIHIICLQAKSDFGSIAVPGANLYVSPAFFDIGPDGRRLYVCYSKAVFCIDMLGSVLWQFSSTSVRRSREDRFAGITLRKRLLYVSLWEGDGIIVLSLSGKVKKLLFSPNIRSPWALVYSNKHLYISQYRSDLAEALCRNIVMLKV